MASILLIEDDEQISNAYTTVLMRKGYEVVSCNAAVVGLEMIRQRAFDLVILDMLMPGLSGLDFLRQANLKQTMPHAKVLVVSNTESPKIIEQAKALGAFEYILKVEYTPEKLTKKIAELLTAK